MALSIGEIVRKNNKTWKKNDFDGWGRGVGIGTIVLSPFCLDERSVDVVWPTGRCFEDLDQFVHVDPNSLKERHEPLHWTILYSSFFIYLSDIRDGKIIDQLWTWFMCRHYAQEFVESSRTQIVRSSVINLEIDQSDCALNADSIGVIDNILKEFEKYKSAK